MLYLKHHKLMIDFYKLDEMWGSNVCGKRVNFCKLKAK